MNPTPSTRAAVEARADDTDFILSGRGVSTDSDEDAHMLARIFADKGWWYRLSDGRCGDASVPLRRLERKLCAAVDVADEARAEAERLRGILRQAVEELDGHRDKGSAFMRDELVDDFIEAAKAALRDDRS